MRAIHDNRFAMRCTGRYCATQNVSEIPVLQPILEAAHNTPSNWF